MSLWTLIKIITGLAVIAAAGVTAMLAYHATVEPVPGIEKIVPSPHFALAPGDDADLTKKLDTAKLPQIDPGEPLFKKASGLLALGHLEPARENLSTIINVFPASAHAAEARRIVGEMNLDDILSSSHRAGKEIHTVKSGDSYLGIAGKYQTTLDSILYLNGMTSLKPLQPGAELVVMRLNYRVLVEPATMAVSLWDDGRFICQYPIHHLGGTSKPASQVLTIQSKGGQLDGRAKRPAASSKRPAAGSSKSAIAPPADPNPPDPPRKFLQLNRHALRIAAFTPEDKDSPGVFLAPEDMEELFLLTRTGNTVEIRNPAK